MEQKLDAAIEAYNLETEINNDCLSCGENIEHPLCPSCIADGFRQWVSQFPREEKELLRQLNGFLKIHKRFNGQSKKCVACGKNTTHLCPYCFTEYLYKITKKAGLGVRALSEFLFLFNFDFKHSGYSKELEAFGGY